MTMEENNQYLPDVDGFDLITKALMDTLNSYPGLEPEEQFKFSTVLNEEGIAVIASSGAFIVDHRVSITDHVWDTCAYPFMIVYRVSGLDSKRKVDVKEWMDTLAKWLTRQPVEINREEYRLSRWPKLSGDRTIRDIIRQTPAYLGSINEDKSENWVMQLTIQYMNEFDR